MLEKLNMWTRNSFYLDVVLEAVVDIQSHLFWKNVFNLPFKCVIIGLDRIGLKMLFSSHRKKSYYMKFHLASKDTVSSEETQYLFFFSFLLISVYRKHN